ncbi:MAG: NPCBM/NEW2 domain-containing protein [Candidatus Omnitrophica bacterium]|nr:NPCBM/NEW2 domain-containing protein [Candidatus Omnitrophota bacterium]
MQIRLVTPTQFLCVISILSFLFIGTARSDDSNAASQTIPILDRIVFSTQSWGELGIDACAHAPGKEPMKLQVGDEVYEKGLGHHANGEILFDLGGDCASFETSVGVQKQAQDQGSVIFKIRVDGEEVFDSGLMRESDPLKEIRIPVEGAFDLELIVEDGGDGITCDCANWINPVLTAASKEARARAERLRFDAAPYARMVTWDPERMDGARSNRVQEFARDEVFLESPVVYRGRGYEVPVWGDGIGCIGLQWAERRMLKKLAIHFADKVDAPPADRIRVQYWVGESPWQGEWKPLEGAIEVEDRSMILSWDAKEYPDLARKGTEKIRWIFPVSKEGSFVQQFDAWTQSHCETTDLRLEAAEGVTASTCEVLIYNGSIFPSNEIDPLQRIVWRPSQPVLLRVLNTVPRPWKSDQTNLCFSFANAGCAVSVEDVKKNKSVFVRDAGIFVSLIDSEETLKSIDLATSGRRTILDQVRDAPDQTFKQAMEHVHNPIQDLGPMMLSLACDNRKFVAHRDGGIEFNRVDDLPGTIWGGQWKGSCWIRPSVRGLGEVTRRLDGGWTPLPVLAGEANGATYTQRTFVAPLGERRGDSLWLFEKPLCVTEWRFENPTDSSVEVAFDLSFSVKDATPSLSPKEDKVWVEVEGKPLAFVRFGGSSGLQVSNEGSTLRWRGDLDARSQIEIVCLTPGWEATPSELEEAPESDELANRTKEYWEGVLAPAMKVRIPDPFLENVIRASQVHCLLAARNDRSDGSIAAWIASDRYGPLESEAHSVILGMDRMGHEEFATRSLDYFIKQYNDAGYLTTGYTLMGTGWHLWTLAEHFDLRRNRAWLESVAPEVARVCEWISDQLEKTKRLDPSGKPLPEYGLMPPGVVADWNRFLYRFVFQAHYYAGLHDAAEALAEIGNSSASALLESASEFKSNILRAYRWSVARTPAFELRTGCWSSSDPSALYCFGPMGEVFPGEDGNRSWCYDVELGAHHLIPTGVIDPHSTEAEAMINHLEDFQFFQSGMGEYPRERNEADRFNLGGFAKVQPYYCRIADIYALRDEVKPFIRSYFNAIPTLLSREILSFWEHFHNIAAWNKTHETGWFLSQTRTMFLMERGGELWLAPFVTNNWLMDGMEVSIENAPTHFGPVDYRLISSVNQGFIDAIIEPPKRNPPESIVLRVSHPEGKSIKRVWVDGRDWKDFDTEKETIRLTPGEKAIHVRVEY